MRHRERNVRPAAVHLLLMLAAASAVAACTPGGDPIAPASAAAPRPAWSTSVAVTPIPELDDGAGGPWREEFERAAAGLLYTSEADYPFEYFALPAPPSVEPLTPATFLDLLGLPQSTPIRERTLDEFFARHTTQVDPHDAASVALIPRYEQLHYTIAEALDYRTTFCIGRILLRCYVAGYEAGGRVVGMATWALET